MENSTYYDELGVQRTATLVEIKRAWALKMREHPPDKDPVGNQRINEAKKTLTDPKAREEYDAMLDLGEELLDLLGQAFDAREREDYVAEAAALKEALAFFPNDHAIRNAYVIALARAKDIKRALKAAHKLVKRAPEIALYHANLAGLLIDAADNGDASLEEALSCAIEAVKLEPKNAEYYILTSRILRSMKRYSEAEIAIEKALWTDGVLDIQDLDALFELSILHIFAGWIDKIEQDINRILEVVQPFDDDDIREYCAYRMTKIAGELADAHSWRLTAIFLQKALLFDPNDQDLKDMSGYMNKMAGVELELKNLGQESGLISPINSMLRTLGRYTLGEITEQEAKGQYVLEIGLLENTSKIEVMKSLEMARHKYPTLYMEGKENFDEWREKLKAATLVNSGSAPEANSGGCAIFLMAVLAGPVILLLRYLFT
jgi:tetratricopeptide (TPR) repeat protein